MAVTVCDGCAGLGIQRCPVRAENCDLAPLPVVCAPVRWVTLDEARRLFPAPRAGWCSSDNIVLAQGPRNLR